jgi:hypothetical protein
MRQYAEASRVYWLPFLDVDNVANHEVAHLVQSVHQPLLDEKRQFNAMTDKVSSVRSGMHRIVSSCSDKLEQPICTQCALVVTGIASASQFQQGDSLLRQANAG